jgi:UPF0755 protein
MKKSQIFFLIIFLFALFSYLFFKQGSLPFNKNDKSTKIFVIAPGQPLQKIIDNLQKEDLIRSKIVFYLIVKQLKIDKKIQAGDFRLSPSMNAYEIAQTLTHGTLDVWVTLIEGTRKEEMAEVLNKKVNISELEFIRLAKEGYLFPDTYLIPKNADAQMVVNILENNFNQKFTKQMEEKGKNKSLTKEQVVILASLLEREAKNFKDKKIIAGILLKRLKADWPLQIDATVQYALGYQPKEKSWWKKNLTSQDLEIDSPYNTYKNKGLPPTPISNPGLDSLTAVVEAEVETPYWYYLSDKKGVVHYAKTLEEHNLNIEKYLN